MSLDHHAEARRLRRRRGSNRGPRDNAGTLDNEMFHAVPASAGDESLRVCALPRLQRRALDVGDVRWCRPQVQQMDGADVLTSCGADERRRHGGVRVDGCLVPVEDLLGCELREAVLEKHRQERMIEGKPNVHTLDTVLEPAVAHTVQQLGTSEVAVCGCRRAQVEDLPRARTHGECLHLHEPDHAFLGVLGDKHLLRKIGDRHQQRRVTSSVPATGAAKSPAVPDCPASSARRGVRPRWPRGTAARCARDRGTMPSG